MRVELLELINSLEPVEKYYIHRIIEELKRAEAKHPEWPKNIVVAAAIVSEESGELIRAALQAELEDHPPIKTESEAIETGAMALRFLINNKSYEKEGNYHKLKDACLRLLNCDHQEHFATRLNNEEFAALEDIKVEVQP